MGDTILFWTALGALGSVAAAAVGVLSLRKQWRDSPHANDLSSAPAQPASRRIPSSRVAAREPTTTRLPRSWLLRTVGALITLLGAILVFFATIGAVGIVVSLIASASPDQQGTGLVAVTFVLGVLCIWFGLFITGTPSPRRIMAVVVWSFAVCAGYILLADVIGAPVADTGGTTFDAMFAGLTVAFIGGGIFLFWGQRATANT